MKNKNYFIATILILIGFFSLISNTKLASASAFSSVTESVREFVHRFQLDLDEKLIKIFKNSWASIKIFFDEVVKFGRNVIYKTEKDVDYKLNTSTDFISFLGNLLKKIYLIIDALFAPIITLSISIAENTFLFLIKIFKILAGIIFSIIDK